MFKNLSFRRQMSVLLVFYGLIFSAMLYLFPYLAAWTLRHTPMEIIEQAENVMFDRYGEKVFLTFIVFTVLLWEVMREMCLLLVKVVFNRGFER